MYILYVIWFLASIKSKSLLKWGKKKNKNTTNPYILSLPSWQQQNRLKWAVVLVVTLFPLELSSQHCAHCARTIPQINVAKTTEAYTFLANLGKHVSKSASTMKKHGNLSGSSIGSDAKLPPHKTEAQNYFPEIWRWHSDMSCFTSLLR